MYLAKGKAVARPRARPRHRYMFRACSGRKRSVDHGRKAPRRRMLVGDGGDIRGAPWLERAGWNGCAGWYKAW